jgi:predicted alpha/beta hydrolase family esterase
MKHLKLYESFGNKTAIIIHGYGVTSDECFYPWLKSSLEKSGYTVELPQLPNPTNPNVDEQVDYIVENYPNKKNIIIGHSFGCPVAMKLVERLNYKIDALVLVSGFIDTNFGDDEEDEVLSDSCDWVFNFSDIKSKANVYILRPNIDSAVTLQQTKDMANEFGVEINYFNPVEDHACGAKEPEILKFINSI